MSEQEPTYAYTFGYDEDMAFVVSATCETCGNDSHFFNSHREARESMTNHTCRRRHG